MRIVAGLGNPGLKYIATRHNVGFMVIDRLAEMLKAEPAKEEWVSEVRQTVLQDEPLVLLKPKTFMNCSGDAIEAVQDAFDPEPESGEILIVTDDVHLPLGTLRLRRSGSNGGHNGLASVETALATREYPRLRIGVGPEPEDESRVDFVLGPFTTEELVPLGEVISTAAEAVRAWLTEDFSLCQSRYNGMVIGATPEAENGVDQREEDKADSELV